ncbi:MAG: hypothetical protein AUG51_10975 [Acidobacteria bacterium 13_1_20CM_3_53_8]|nr:MAG: hypothetical protein AUG51_10975 [Acidobacteria bacterium 13_1_20CM_3_53_8]
MSIPQFNKHLETRPATENAGDLFQTFVYEVLLEDYEGLHLFPGGGKDGGIDLIQTVEEPRLVVECKYIGNGGLDEARQRWRGVAGNLSKHIVHPDGPTKGESQYKPWYRNIPGISRYIFCVSCVLSNQAGFESLQHEIEGFFHHLGEEHEHLKHLRDLSVTILDWSELWGLLQRRPRNLLLKWFPEERIPGLVKLAAATEHTSFRSYLNNDKLSYYSRSQHLILNPAPEGLEIPDEDALLDQLKEGELTGLIITGSGGIGKTRLMLELGRLAESKDWVVRRVLSNFTEESIERFASMVTTETRVLLLIDYIETQRTFAQLVDTLIEFNSDRSLHLRFVANCRTSYYPSVATTQNHKRVDLSPLSQDSAFIEWLGVYRQETARYILSQSGLSVSEKQLTVFQDMPVLAAFISYLYRTRGQQAFEQLLEAEDFSRWVQMRVRLSFGEETIPRDLALLIAMLPMTTTSVSKLDLQKYGDLLNRSAIDGWVEKLPVDELHAEETWESAHDVIADRILLSYLETIAPTIEFFVRELLNLARASGVLRSALITLQRVAAQPLLKSLNWARILDDEIGKAPHDWLDVRDILISTSLLQPLEIIELLGKHEAIWESAEEKGDFQYGLARLIEWALSDEGEDLIDEARKSILISWTKKAAAHATVSNYILTRGIRFCPEVVRKYALNWIVTRPHVFQTHYLMVVWLNQGESLEDITSSVKIWSTSFERSYHLSFVVRAWLKAGGDKEILREHIAAWLGRYRNIAEARFVYKAWLDASGDKELVREGIVAWLAEHRTDLEADFVYRSWLDAGGDKELVREAIAAWLVEHKSIADAGFVYEAWLDAGGDKELVQDSIVAWLVEHKVIIEAGFVYHAWLDAGGDKELVREDIVAWLAEHRTDLEADFVYRSWLDAGGDLELVRDVLVAWLEVHGDYSEADFVIKGWLERRGDFSLVRSAAIRWLSQNYDKERAVYLTKFLAKQKDIPIETIKSILKWCQGFPNNEDAIWRLNQLRSHLLEKEVAEEVYATSEIVLKPLLLRTGLKPVTRGLIISLLSYLISASGLYEGQLRERVDILLLEWLRHPQSYGSYLQPELQNQRASYFRRIKELIDKNALSVTDDRESLVRFLHWINNWDEERKLELSDILESLERRYPDPELWGIIKISS